MTSLFNPGSLTSWLTMGSAAAHSKAGRAFSTTWQYPFTSSFLTRKPMGSPNATSEMTSKVKYCATRAKSIGFISLSTEICSLSINCMRSKMRLSTLSSRYGFSFPEYCDAMTFQHVLHQSTPRIAYPWSQSPSKFQMTFFIALRKDMVELQVKLSPAVKLRLGIWRAYSAHLDQ